jgi:hypothetical protein
MVPLRKSSEKDAAVLQQKVQLKDAPPKEELRIITPVKAAQTERLYLKRRDKMVNQNLIIIYFDGVIGDLFSKHG